MDNNGNMRLLNKDTCKRLRIAITEALRGHGDGADWREWRESILKVLKVSRDQLPAQKVHFKKKII